MKNCGDLNEITMSKRERSYYGTVHIEKMSERWIMEWNRDMGIGGLSLYLTDSPSDREPSCFELEAVTNIQHKNPQSDISPLCSFYKQSCPAPLSIAACTRLAEEKCRQKQRRCGESLCFHQTLLQGRYELRIQHDAGDSAKL
ncbi:unnamed protein product [Ranitomeya imitator]|uniref:Uncharacterized protein n=1 Tax=Ranitomeya imitator TaxID=111125 RepID=A0ABN9KVQ2_9NEOB|nr:unnamed protein product [Ranitomeya imitator]